MPDNFTVTFDIGHKITFKMTKEKESTYEMLYRCGTKFYDRYGNVTQEEFTTTTTTTSAITTEITPTGSPLKPTTTTAFPQKMVIIIGSASVGFLFLCILIICCLVCSCRSEKLKRKRTEAEYRAVATTLTSITDTEDGTTYETITMNQGMMDPTYHDRGGVQLPVRKDRNRLGGVSNTLTHTVKRWFSTEGATASENATASPYPVRKQPLPAIPEANHKSNSFPRVHNATTNRVSVLNPEYEEIGPDIFRRSNVYNPLDSAVAKQATQEPYEHLRKSTLLKRSASDKSQPLSTIGEVDNYFVVEKNNSSAPPPPGPNIEESHSDSYFIVERAGSSRSDASSAKVGAVANEDTHSDSYFIVERADSGKSGKNQNLPSEELPKVLPKPQVLPKPAKTIVSLKQTVQNTTYNQSCTGGNIPSVNDNEKTVQRDNNKKDYITVNGSCVENEKYPYSKVDKKKPLTSFGKTPPVNMPLTTKPCVNSVPQGSSSINDNGYFILEKTSKTCSSVDSGDETDYLEPVEKQRHSYIDVLAEQDEIMKTRGKISPESKESTHL